MPSRADVKASSRELLESFVAPRAREAILGLVDDAPDAQRLLSAGGFHRTEKLGYVELLRVLLDTDSDSLRSLAVYHIGELGLSELKPSLDALAPADAMVTAAGMPETFQWQHLLVDLAVTTPVLAEAEAGAPEAAAIGISATAGAVPELVAVLAALEAPAEPAQGVTVAPAAPALVTIAEPAAQPAPSAILIPTELPADPVFDAYARMFQGIENRDLIAPRHLPGRHYKFENQLRWRRHT